MRYRLLGRTGLSVSEIGFGCASWWGKPAFAEETAIGLVRQAVDLGVTFFDTGASYSAGEAEPRLGRALKGLDASKLVIASKAGTYHAGGGKIARDFSAAAIVASVEQSLKNLGLEQLSLLQLHGPAIHELDDELLGALEGLKARGLIRALGANSFDPAVIEHVIGLAAFDAVMVDYNVLRPERARLVDLAAAEGKGVLAGMALGMGHIGVRLAHLKGPQDIWYAARGLMKHRTEVRRGARFGFLTPPQALAWVLENPRVACAVIGTTRAEHLAQNVTASGLVLDPSLRARIASVQARLE
jgi:aryl-alcohol dehydrogenase-like predicted oxidoreductase